MPFNDPESCLRDIRDSIRLIEEFVTGLDFERYRRDLKTQAAVERKFLVISEAAVRLGDDAERLCAGVPWSEIRGIGNWLRHAYDRVDPEIVWDTIRIDLPPLAAAIDRALAHED
ncbi:MAG: DUF86 domain-containing protein [Acidobacteriota bacterium]